MSRTFSKADFEASLEAWKTGEFSDEWKPYRHQAAMGGMIFPPEGTKHDSWEDEEPSQRAMLIRAIRETPTLMHEAIAKSRTWYQVVDYIIRRRDEWREEIDAKERAAERRRQESREIDRHAPASIKAILSRIGDS